MLKRALVGLAILVAGLLLLGAGGLGWAHWAIRSERSPLPTVEAVGRLEPGPVRLAWINTASQAMARAVVLDPERDPRPEAPYVMSHPSFVLEWADGRILLIDAGMTREGAEEFGGPLEMLAGAEPIRPHGSVGEKLGAAGSRVRGLVFTHLHADHVGGVPELCEGAAGPISVFMTPAQAERSNYTTRPGLSILNRTACLERQILPDGREPLRPLAGFPGVAAIAAAGHTPGSQLILARLGEGDSARTYAFAGDIANNIDGIMQDIDKPALYRWLIVPEDSVRLRALRGFLRALAREQNVAVLVSHDELDLERSGLPAFSARSSR